MDSLTEKYNVNQIRDAEIATLLHQVCGAIEMRGYSSVDQLVGYFISGDPCYITAKDNARNLVQSLSRDQLLEAILRTYISGLRSE